jgi:quinoprotein glucose dehydrogenase
MLYVPSLTSPIITQVVKQDQARGTIQYRRGGTQLLPTLDGIPVYKGPYARVTAYNLNAGTIAWQTPVGDGPRHHPLLQHLKLGPLGNGNRGNPLVTATLLFVSQASGGLGRAEALKVGDRELTNLPPEPPKFRAFDKGTGEIVWEHELPVGPAATPMTYSYGAKQYVVLAIGGGIQSELIAFALP